MKIQLIMQIASEKLQKLALQIYLSMLKNLRTNKNLPCLLSFYKQTDQ